MENNIKNFKQNEDNLNKENLGKLLREREISWSTEDFIDLILTKGKSFSSKCHSWIQSLRNQNIDLHTVRRDCSDLLELSDLLNICGYAMRDHYQEKFTLVIEQIGYYIKADELIENEVENISEETPTIFIDNLFSKLKQSGFVYHPTKNFNILSCIFMRQPELMNRRMEELLEIITGKEIRIWERDPFASALIKLLSFYVGESEETIKKTKDNKEIIVNNMHALAIQMLLIDKKDDSGIADYNLSAARYCTLASQIIKRNAEKLVNTAYYSLFNSEAKLPPYSIDKISMLQHYITNSNEEVENIDTVNIFTQDDISLSVSNEGIHMLSPGDKELLKPVFPKTLELWKGLQVYLPTKTKTKLVAVKPNNITPYKEVWNEIESALFNPDKTALATAAKIKKQHHIGDEVLIEIYAQDSYDKKIFYCEIKDEIGGYGYIHLEDIVGYNVQASMDCFSDKEGCFIFEAHINDIQDDLFEFSMIEEIKAKVAEFYPSGKEIICSVGGSPNQQYGMAPAVSVDGLSVSIINAGDSEFANDLKRGDIVRCSVNGQTFGDFHVSCDIIDYDIYRFDLTSAFCKLMNHCRVQPEPDTAKEAEQNNDKLINEAYVKEVIYMIARMAIIETDYVKSYNYLGFARCLCLLIGWKSQAAYYKGRMEIVSMLHDFAKNLKVDEEKLSRLENENAELFNSNMLIKEKFMQLQIVSYTGKPQYNTELFKFTEIPELKELASLVLAHNITQESCMAKQAEAISNRIRDMLNLKGYETDLLFYGEENETTEFKTSWIFPPKNKRDDSNSRSSANPTRQKNEILKVVNSFLNTEGGKLYIGVSDFGYGFGVETDLNDPMFNGDKDKYKRNVQDAIKAAWSNLEMVKYIKVYWDERNTEKDVLVVEVEKIENGLPYEDLIDKVKSWYIRGNGFKERFTEEEFLDYKKHKRTVQNLKKEEVEVEVTEKEVAAEPAMEETKEVAAEPQKPTQEATNNTLQVYDDEKIKTSRIRKNVLVSWEDDYVEPIALFKFLDNYKFSKINKYDFDESTLLTLAVKDSEKNGYLVLGYENGAIVKVPVEVLLGFSSQEYTRNQDCRLVFASLAGEDDAVLTIVKENKSRPKTFMRVDRLKNFEAGMLTDKGEIPYNEDLISEVLAFDIIPGEHLDDFRGTIDRPKTSLGQSSTSGTTSITNKLYNWGINEI